jgi:RND family efflux transporter MFP subunit
MFALLVMAGSGTGVYGVSQNLAAPAQTPVATTQLVPVAYRNISQTLTVAGTLVYYNSQQLTFGASGTVKEIKVSEGAAVKAGDVLANFDDASARSLQKAYTQAQQALETANENLEKAKKPYSEADIAQAQAALTSTQVAVNSAQANLDKAKAPYTAADLAQAQAAITTAQIAVNASKENLTKAKNPYSEADIAQARLAVINAQIAVNTAQDNLYKAQHPYSDEEIEDAEEAVAAAEEDLTNAIDKAATDIAKANDAIDDAYDDYLEAREHGSLDDRERAYNTWQSALVNLNTIRASAEKSIKAAQDKLEQAQETLDKMLADPDPLNIQQKDQQLVIALLNLTLTQENLAKILAGPDALNVQQKEEALVVAENNLAKATDNLAEMKKGPDALTVQQREEQLQVAKNSLVTAAGNLAKMQEEADALTVQLKQIEVDAAQAAVDLAQKQAASNGLVAPAAGTITVINIKAGQSVGATATAMELTDTSVYALTASVNELDIPQVVLGQSARVTVDAISNQGLSGKVQTISQTATTQSGVVSYRITVLVTAGAASLRSGMSASAEVVVQEASHVLAVPNKAVGGTPNNPTVSVMVNGAAETRSVTTGLSDDSYTEILSGLSEGERVIIAGGSVPSTRTTTPQTTSTGRTNNTFVPGGQFPGGGVIITGGPPAGGGGGVFVP